MTDIKISVGEADGSSVCVRVPRSALVTQFHQESRNERVRDTHIPQGDREAEERCMKTCDFSVSGHEFHHI